MDENKRQYWKQLLSKGKKEEILLCNNKTCDVKDEQHPKIQEKKPQTSKTQTILCEKTSNRENVLKPNDFITSKNVFEEYNKGANHSVPLNPITLKNNNVYSTQGESRNLQLLLHKCKSFGDQHLKLLGKENHEDVSNLQSSSKSRRRASLSTSTKLPLPPEVPPKKQQFREEESRGPSLAVSNPQGGLKPVSDFNQAVVGMQLLQAKQKAHSSTLKLQEAEGRVTELEHALKDARQKLVENNSELQKSKELLGLAEDKQRIESLRFKEELQAARLETDTVHAEIQKAREENSLMNNALESKLQKLKEAEGALQKLCLQLWKKQKRFEDILSSNVKEFENKFSEVRKEYETHLDRYRNDLEKTQCELTALRTSYQTVVAENACFEKQGLPDKSLSPAAVQQEEKIELCADYLERSSQAQAKRAITESDGSKKQGTSPNFDVEKCQKSTFSGSERQKDVSFQNTDSKKGKIFSSFLDKRILHCIPVFLGITVAMSSLIIIVSSKKKLKAR